MTKRQASSPIYLESTRPVPHDVFLACVEVYAAAAELKMPVTNPQEFKVGVGEQTFAFSDTPMNRGMVGLKTFLAKDQKHLFTAVYARVMAIGEAITRFEHDPRFANYFRPRVPDGPMLVEEALLAAGGVAKFKSRTFDLDEISLLEEAAKLRQFYPD